ncbi:MAG: hypothetical protein AMXMBFR64_36240 [Myxococcales bacterium]
MSSPRPHRPLAAALLVAVISGCTPGDLSLGGCQGGLQGTVDDLIGGTWDLAPTALVAPAVRVRLTQSGFDLVAERIRDLITLVFEQDEHGRILIPLDQFLSEPIVLPELGIPDLIEVQAKLWFQNMVLSLDWDALKVELVDDPPVPARIRISISGGRIGVASGRIAGSATFKGGQGGTARADVDLACEVIDQKGGEDGGPTYMAGADVVIDVALDTDLEGKLQVGAELVSFTLEPPAFRTEPACATAPECQDGDTQPCFECEAVCILNFEEGNLDTLVASLQEQLEPALLGIANELVANVLSSDLNGQPLRIGGRLPLLDLLASVAAGLGEVFPSVRDLAFSFAPAPAAFAVLAGGLNVTLDGGVEAAEVHPCAAAMGPPPDFASWTRGPAPAFQGSGAYHVGAAVPQALVDEAVWAAAATGVLCLQIDSQTVRRLTGLTLTSGAIDLLLPGLRGLAGDRAPLLLTLEPHLTAGSFPVTTLSPPAVDGHQSLMRVVLPGAGISLYVLVAERWVRVFEIDADVEVEASVVVVGPNVLTLTLDRVGVTEVRETYNELLPTAELGRIVPVVVELAMTLLLGQPLSLEADLGPLIEGAINLPLSAAVEGIAPDGPLKDWIALVLSLHPKAEGALTASVETTASVIAGGDGAVTLAVDPLTETQWRVDGTLWRPFAQASAVRVAHPLLALPGEHLVEVRGRLPGAWRTLDESPAEVRVVTGSDGLVPTPPAEPAIAAAPGGCSAGASGGLLSLLVVALLLRRRA